MTDANDFIPLRSVELDILLGVVDRPRHGYAILQEAEDRAGGRAGFEIPTLYRALHRLQESGLVARAEPPNVVGGVDERRDYWRATMLGRDVLRAELARLDAALAIGRIRMAREEGK